MHAERTGLSRPLECSKVMAQFPVPGRNSDYTLFFTLENKKNTTTRETLRAVGQINSKYSVIIANITSSRYIYSTKSYLHAEPPINLFL
jgi:hypothetical protein